MLLYGAARLLTGETFGIVALIDNFMPLILLPTLVLLPPLLLLRRWLLLALILPTALGFVVIYGGMFLPRAAADAPPDLTLMTYNMKTGNHDIRGLVGTYPRVRCGCRRTARGDRTYAPHAARSGGRPTFTLIPRFTVPRRIASAWAFTVAIP